MRVEGPFVEGVLIRRAKRFLMDLRLPDGSPFRVHCANSGSMEGCLREGAPVLASPGKGPGRRYSHTAEWIRFPDGWVGINTLRTNRIAEEALHLRRIPELAAYTGVRPEARISAHSRSDFILTEPGLPDCYVEVKNTTFPTVEGAVGFPDSVTERGQKHLRELMAALKRGHRAVMLFAVNRPEGTFFRPAKEKDPEYARLLKLASRRGVEILARRIRIDPPDAVLDEPLEVRL
jgi:sugar fermentation stimulation protein A